MSPQGQIAEIPDAMWSVFKGRFPRAYADRERQPGVHALVIGVSSYPKLAAKNLLGLEQLTCAATSAAEFANWLLEAYPEGGEIPLRSVRLLLSPSDQEETAMQRFQTADSPRANQNNVEEALIAWADDMDWCAGNFAVMYVAGHGVNSTGLGPHLLLEDFRDSHGLRASLDTSSIHLNLGYFPRVSRSALFVDCCQNLLPDSALKLGDGLALPYNSTRAETRDGSAVYFAAPRGESALGVVGGRTLFLDTLLKCLRDGQAGEPRAGREGWCVNSYSLNSALQALIPPEQTLDARLERKEFEICLISGVPSSKIAVRVQPPTSHIGTAGQITSEDEESVVPFEMTQNPQPVGVRCGTYTVSLQAQPGTVRPRRRIAVVKPPLGGTVEFEVLK